MATAWTAFVSRRSLSRVLLRGRTKRSFLNLVRSVASAGPTQALQVVWVLASADGVVFDTLRPNYTGPPQTSHTLLTLPRWPGSGLMSRSLSKAGNISSLFVRGNEGDFLNEHGAVVFWLNHVESYHVAEEFHCGLLAPVATSSVARDRKQCCALPTCFFGLRPACLVFHGSVCGRVS